MDLSLPTAPVRTASVAIFDKGHVNLEEIVLPPRNDGEIDVAISTAAICGSDLHTVLGHRESPARSTLGHEGVGQVLDLDPGTVDLRGLPLSVGDRVVFALFSACRDCDRCDAGLEMKCRSLVKYGHESVSVPPYATGTLADNLRLLPGVPVVKVDTDLDDVTVVSAGCAVATAAAVVSAAGPVAANTRALVLGAGAVGAYCIAMLASLGCAVDVRDPSAPRVELAERLGASHPQSIDGSYDIVVEASGNPIAVQEAVSAADVGGRIVAAGSVSPGHSTVTIDPAEVVTRRLSIIGVHNYRAEDLLRGIDWLQEHGRHLPLDRLVSPPLGLRDVREGFELMREARFPRVLIQPDNRGQGVT